MIETKINQVKTALLQGKRLSDAYARDNFGYTRLSDAIYKLKKRGYDILSEWKEGFDRFKNPVRYKEYWLNIVCCSDCKHLQYESQSHEQPYPEFWCSKGKHDGISSFSDLDTPIKCDKFENK